MITSHTKRVLLMLIAGAALALTSSAAVAQATPAPTQFVFSSYWGWDVNETTGGDICTVASRDKCSEGNGQVKSQESTEPGGFNFPKSVAVDNDPASPEYSDVYVSDENNHRVQVLSPAGVLVSMFGWGVNKTMDETAGATQAEKNVCAAASGDVCKAGEKGEATGQIGEGFSIATDATSGDVYLFERAVVEGGRAVYRVQEFTATGTWVLGIGKEVNETKKTNLCTELEVEAESVKCQGPAPAPAGSVEHGAFNPSASQGNVLAVGGPEDLLYVGDEHRVQEFKASDGEWKGEIPLTSISAEPENDVMALAVDKTGDIYLMYGAGAHEGSGNTLIGPTVIRGFSSAGTQVAEFEITPGEANPERVGFYILSFALDSYGRLGVVTREKIEPGENEPKYYDRGALYTTSGVRISEFVPPSGSIPGDPVGLAFAASSDDLYFTTEENQEVGVFAPAAAFPEAVTCAASEVGATSAVLCGGIDPNGSSARGFFEYQPVAGSRTSVAFEGDGMSLEPVSWRLTGLVPNETYGFAAAAEAEVAGKEETGHGEQLSFHTATPRPEVPGSPSASDVTNAFALLTATVNPEHAPARYHFQYGPCAVLAGCAGVASTPVEESSVYGQLGAIQEIVGLQPQTTYSYRLIANNEHEETGHVSQGGETVGVEGHFTTGSSPVPVAQTGGASGVGATSATITGLVDPDGQPAVYAFELGVYNGASARYGVVFSGAAGDSTTAVPESLGLTGLQPGTMYAYRVVLKSGYGESTGQTVVFTTEGLPSVLAVPAPLSQLAVPAIAFPGEAKAGTTTKKATPKCKRGQKLSHNKCVAEKQQKKAKRAEKSSRSRKARR